MTVAFIFPGQGSQSVGMGKDLAENFPEARAVFAEVDDALGEKLSETIFSGPEDKLTLTANAQPALMAVSIALLKVLEAKGLDSSRRSPGRPFPRRVFRAVRGRHFRCRHGAPLLRIRGNAMQAAVPGGAGAMAANRPGTCRCRGDCEGGVLAARSPTTVVASWFRREARRSGGAGTDRGASAPSCCRLRALPFDADAAADAMREALASVAKDPSSLIATSART